MGGISMKYYTLYAIVNGKHVKLKRNCFESRDQAINYMFDYYEKHYLYNLEVEDEHIVNDNKHSIEYVCNFHNRFIVTRYQTQA